jgi:hypothetical protein
MALCHVCGQSKKAVPNAPDDWVLVCSWCLPLDVARLWRPKLAIVGSTDHSHRSAVPPWIGDLVDGLHLAHGIGKEWVPRSDRMAWMAMILVEAVAAGPQTRALILDDPGTALEMLRELE